MLTLLRVALARIRAFLRPGDLERDFDEELASHLAMAEEEKIRQGMAPDEARRIARVELGGLTQLREASREIRGLPWLDTFWLDIKLSVRMLRKSWGLTLVGGLAMTIAIGIGLVVFWLLEMVFWPTLPLDEGDRVVALQTWDDKTSRRHETLESDFERWQGRLRSVKDIGAFRTVERNLVIAEGSATPVFVAEITASGFQLARVPPLLGRPLVDADQRDGALPVAVIGYDEWQKRFSADSAAVGRTIRLSGTDHTIVGVMPKGFAFPVSHGFWTPLRVAPSGDRQEGSADVEESVDVVFARLAPGATLEGAQAELTALGLVPPVADSTSSDRLRPCVVPYALSFAGDIERGEVPWAVRIVLLLVVLLLVPPCANIAILVYARTLARYEEFAARFALGASRSRVVGQLFIEVLVLAAVAAGAALLLASLAGAAMRDFFVGPQPGGGVPFWIDFTPSFQTVLFAAGLALVAALIAGVVPALEATRRQLSSGIRAPGSRIGLQLGGTWTALVVAQVALTLAALPSAIEMGWGTVRKGMLGPGFAAEEYLTARLAVDQEAFERRNRQAAGDDRPFARRFGALQADLVRQLKAEPGVLGVTLAMAVPGEEPWAGLEAEARPSGDSLFGPPGVEVNHVDEAFFEVLDIPLLTGRGFEAGDFESPRSAVIVSQTFARQLLGDGNPLGRRVHYTYTPDGKRLAASEPVTWYEIVGVVADRPAHSTTGTMYHPIASGQVHPASVVLHVGAGVSPSSLADRLREVTSALDPTFQVQEIVTLDEIYRENQIGNSLGALSLTIVTLSVLLLSAAGMYALMSFTVNQRRREIGIRSALGAQPHRLLTGVFQRVLRQVGLGSAIGALVALLLDYYLPVERLGGWNVPGIVPVAAAFMLMVGLLSAAGPARRGLRVDPIAVLREG